MRFHRRPRPEPAINLTPLIDILFLVLMFLVLTATFRRELTLEVALPTAETAETATPAPRSSGDRLLVVVTADGEVRIGQRVVASDDLEDIFSTGSGRATPRVLLSADARASHGAVVTVMDQARRAGVVDLRLETTPAPPPRP